MIHSMLDYINRSPDCFHAVENLRLRLLEEGYQQLREGAWQLVRGGKYFTIRNGSSLIAFRVPLESFTGFMVSAAHSDSPCFRLRDHAELKGDYIRLSAERYGGMIQPSWLDRPLSVAGRVLVRQGNMICTKLVNMKKDMALIPHVAVHINRDVNTAAKYDPATDLVALYAGSENQGSFLKEIAAEIGCDKEDIAASDLFLYNNQPGAVWGPEGEFLSAPRLDDLACVYTCTEGFLTACERHMVPMLCVFDNEEIGSETKQGAGATMLPETAAAICEAFGVDQQAMIAGSFMLSCDNGHAIHPNHPELADKSQFCLLNGGVVVKHSPRYATDGMSAAVFTEICRRAGVKVQHYANRPDQAGGSTLGNIANTKFPVSTVDIGMAQLAMHSSFETMGSRDVADFSAAVRACYECDLRFDGDVVTVG